MTVRKSQHLLKPEFSERDVDQMQECLKGMYTELSLSMLEKLQVSCVISIIN